MKKILKGILPLTLIFFATLFTSCEKFGIGEDYNRVVLLYLAANNNLSGYAEDNIDALKAGYLPGENELDIMLVYRHLSGSNPELIRLYRDASGKAVEDIVAVYQDQNSATPLVLRSVLNKMKSIFPADDYGLILWSHATGWLPEGYYSRTKSANALFEDPYADIVKSFGEDRGTEMEITDLKNALPFDFEFIIFDCCFMGGIETVYELRDKAEYIVASPTEILATGFPYDKVIRPMFEYEADLSEVCNIFYNHYKAQGAELPTAFNSATIALYDTDELENLASVCRQIFEGNRDKIAALDRYSVQPYYRFDKDYFFDLEHFVSKIATPLQLTSFREALSDVVIAKWNTPHVLGIPIENYSGISVYIPKTPAGELEQFYKGFSWNTDTKLVN